jgi:hypothetical protein
MNGRLIARVALMGSFLTAGSVLMAAETPPARTGDTDGLLFLKRAGSPLDLALEMRKLKFSRMPAGELNRLVSMPDCTVALAAGWERVRRTMPEAKKNEVASPDKAAISRFLGLIEGRVQTPIPEDWETAVKSAFGSGQWSITFSSPNSAKIAFAPKRPLKRSADRWIVEPDGQSIQIPPGYLVQATTQLAMHLAGKTAYVVLYNSLPFPYRLYAIDKDSGQVIWTSEVWPFSGVIFGTGIGCHDAMIRSTDESVAVFGLAGGCAYVDVFDKTTGENRCRFSTGYSVYGASRP